MSHELNVKQLQAAARDMSIYFDPPLNFEEEDVDALIAEITENASNLQQGDDLEDSTKTVLKSLGVGPWLGGEEPRELAPEPDFSAPVEAEEDAEDEGPIQEEESVVAKSKPAKKVGASRYGHRAGSMSGAIDELIYKGTGIDDACKVLEVQFKKSKKAILVKFKSHVKHLINNKGVSITIKDGYYKAGK
jgi:hypothetical protein